MVTGMEARRRPPYRRLSAIRGLDAGSVLECARASFSEMSSVRAPEAAKMKQLRERGDAARYHGQIGRSQTHYTVEDYPLMRQVFGESLWPILQAPGTVIALVCNSLPHRY